MEHGTAAHGREHPEQHVVALTLAAIVIRSRTRNQFETLKSTSREYRDKGIDALDWMLLQTRTKAKKKVDTIKIDAG